MLKKDMEESEKILTDLELNLGFEQTSHVHVVVLFLHN